MVQIRAARSSFRRWGTAGHRPDVGAITGTFPRVAPGSEPRNGMLGPVRRAWPAGLVITLAVAAGCATPSPPPTGDAATALAALPVKGRAPQTGYSRDAFGQRWADADRDGCDQRNQVLARDLASPIRRGRCVVLSGTLHDPYSGHDIAFLRGPTTSDDVQIDHVVALSDAWQTGAQQLDAPTRERFAGDPLNLLAVEGRLNQAKGDGDAATWLPPNTSYRCSYVSRQVAVKAKYHLWVTPAERDAVAQVLSGCPGQALPADSAVLGAD